jgi:hypothetical protein
LLNISYGILKVLLKYTENKQTIHYHILENMEFCFGVLYDFLGGLLIFKE